MAASKKAAAKLAGSAAAMTAANSKRRGLVAGAPEKTEGLPGGQAAVPVVTPAVQPEAKPAKRRGRPGFVATPEQRERVVIAAAARMRHEDIAAALGISEPTLRKHFAAELTTKVTECRLQLIQAMYQAAQRGNVSAARVFVPKDVLEQAGIGPDPREVEKARRAQEALERAESMAKGEKLGKKAQAMVDSKTAEAGTDWEGILPAVTLQ